MDPNNPYDSPQHMASAGTPIGTRQVCIKRIDILSAAAMMGVLYAILGLIVGGFLALYSRCLALLSETEMRHLAG